MDVSSAVTTPYTTASQSTAKSDKASLADDFDTFLTLLTAQLQNQDPLSPTDTNEFTNQIVQFSNVEQSIQTNSNLETLIALSQAGAIRDAVTYIGKQVTLESDKAYLQNGQVQWNYNIGDDAASVQLVINDTAGIPVYTEAGATTIGEHSFTWDGKNASGVQLPEGIYELNIIAKDADGKKISTTTTTAGIVTGVTPNNGQPQIKVGKITYNASDVKSVDMAPSGQ